MRRRLLLAVALLGAALLGLPGAGGAAAGDRHVTSQRPDLAREVFALVNSYRASRGAPPLEWDDRLAAAAAWFAYEQASRCRFEDQRWEGEGYTMRRLSLRDCSVGHTDSLGRGPGERAAAFGYPWPGAVSENVVYNWSGAREALESWQGSPGHDANQLNPSYRWGAAGVACTRYEAPEWDNPQVCQYVMMFARALPAGPGGGAGGGPMGAPERGPSSGPGEGRAAPRGRVPAPVPADPCAGREPPAPPQAMALHRVEAGDTLSGLAARYLGDPSRFCDLAAWNGIGAPFLLRVGQELRVPAPPGQGEEEQQERGAAGDAAGVAHLAAGDGAASRGDSVAPEQAEAAGVETAEVKEASAPGKSHPLVAAIGRLLRRLRELWPW